MSRRLLLSIAFLSLAGSNAFAALSPCNTYTSLQEYIDQGSTGCTLGDKVFKNFAFSFSGGTTLNTATAPLVPASSDVLASTSIVGQAYSITFDFAGKASVAAFQTMDLIIQYDVAVMPGDYDITSVSTTETGAIRRPSVNHKPFSQVLTRICTVPYEVGIGNDPSGICNDPPSHPGTEANVTPAFVAGGIGGLLNDPTANDTLDPNVVANQNTHSSSVASANLHFVSVYDEVLLNGDGVDAPPGTSQSALSTVTNTFTQSYDPTPEPATMTLFGSALIGLGLIGRRRLAR